MKYEPDIIKKVCGELQKVPNIRYVCGKIGIDHSTFYRWFARHEAFRKDVLVALRFGREKISDAAESVIINEIQNNNFRAATYWLSHNSDRYVGIERVAYHQYLNNQTLKILSRPADPESMFETLFKLYCDIERVFGKKLGKAEISPLIEGIFRKDRELIDIFYSTYQGWKDDNNNLKKIREDFNIGET